MKKQVLISVLLIMVALMLALTGSVLASGQMEPRTLDGMVNNNTGLGGGSASPTSQNTNPVDDNLSQGETQNTTDLNGIFNNLASSNPEKKDNRGMIITAVVAVTIVLIAGLITWWYRTNY